MVIMFSLNSSFWTQYQKPNSQNVVIYFVNQSKFPCDAAAQRGPGPSHSWRLEITHNNALQSVWLLWTSDQPVAETSNLTTHNTHNRQTSMPPEEFEPTILASDRPQTHALDRAAAGTGNQSVLSLQSPSSLLLTNVCLWLNYCTVYHF